MYRVLTIASLCFVLPACSDPDCAPGERKIGRSCHDLSGVTMGSDAQVEDVATTEEGGGTLDAGMRSSEAIDEAAFNDSGTSPPSSDGGPQIVQLALGETTTYVLWSDGTASQWGQYDLGEDLDPKALGREGPVPFHTSAKPLPHIANAKQLHISSWNACALFVTGEVGCWGNHSAIFAGGVPSSEPQMVADLTGVTHMSNAMDHACAVTSQKQVRCWGDASASNFVFPDSVRTELRLLPDKQAFPISGSMADEVSSGGGFSCLRNSFGVHCWGTNDHGQLGDGTNEKRAAPRQIVGLTDVVEIKSGWTHTCARIGSGEVRCWGSNKSGQIGDGTEFTANVPVKVQSLSRVVGLALGERHSCALHDSGQVSCWGANQAGQLGDGTQVNRNTPVTVVGLSNVVEVAAGIAHTCARLKSGEVRCWGLNEVGQLGDGTTLSRTTPVAVQGLQ